MENQDISTISNILKKIPLFENLDPTMHQEVIKHITMEYFPQNYAIFKEGDVGNDMYIIKTGLVKIYHQGKTPEEDLDIAVLGDNDFFGEMALISDYPRNATAMVVEPAQVFKLNKQDLIKLITENPDIAAKISNEYLSRLKVNIRSGRELL